MKTRWTRADVEKPGKRILTCDLIGVTKPIPVISEQTESPENFEDDAEEDSIDYWGPEDDEEN